LLFGISATLAWTKENRKEEGKKKKKKKEKEKEKKCSIEDGEFEKLSPSPLCYINVDGRSLLDRLDIARASA